MSWDATTYMRFGDERTRPAAELLARVAADAPKAVVDLGCGPGNSTALLAARWSKAQLTGVDNAALMLTRARASTVSARWVEADIAHWESAEILNVIFANASLHWVSDHHALLPRLIEMLHEGGTLAIQMPRNFSAPSHVLLRETAQSGPWAAHVANVRPDAPVHEPEVYANILEPLVSRLDIWETEYLQRLEGEDAVFRWVEGTALVPYKQKLSPQEYVQFTDEYRARLRRAYPRRNSGITHFPFLRLFIVAQR